MWVNPQSIGRWSFDDLFTLLSYRLRELNWCAPRSWQIIQQRLSAHQWDTQKPPILWSLAEERSSPHPDCLPVDFPLTKRSERCGNIQNMGFVGLASGKCKKNNKIIFDLFWMDGPWLVPMCSTASVYVQLPLLPGNNFHDHQHDGHHHQHDEHQQQHHQQHHDHDNGRYAAVSNLRPWSCASEEIPRYWIYAGWPWKRIIVLLASIKPFEVDFVNSYSRFSLFKIIYC